jgi:hypothetical protein
MEPKSSLPCSEESTSPRWVIISTSPSPQARRPPLSAVRYCLFSIFVATLHIWRPSPPLATPGCAMSWWQKRNVKMANKSFENVTNVKYVSTEINEHSEITKN